MKAQQEFFWPSCAKESALSRPSLFLRGSRVADAQCSTLPVLWLSSGFQKSHTAEGLNNSQYFRPVFLI